jgi:hypothetical protein
VEHVIRTLSWTFVFGAVATLLYTSFKPFWHDLLAAEFPQERIRGAMIEIREVEPEVESEPVAEVKVAEAVACAENPAADERCPHPPR